jgi:hypothetical protein
MTDKKRNLRMSFKLLVLVVALSFGSGCSAPFKYKPKYEQSYAPVLNNRGLEIVKGQDLRKEEEKQPHWSKKVEVIVAHALADELNHAKLFKRVNVRSDRSSVGKNFSHFVEFRVKKFQLYNPTHGAEKFGRNALGRLGWRGVLIAASMPAKFVSEVEVEFEVFDAATKQSVFTKSYSETRSLNANGYEDTKPQLQQTSEALEAVVAKFVKDLTTLPLSRQSR